MTGDGAILLGDIGGTHARFALLCAGRLSDIAWRAVSGYSSIDVALAEFLGAEKQPIAGAVLAVAGPVESNRCALTNSAWTIDGAQLREAFGWSFVDVVNDFEAVAWALPHLTGDDVLAIGGGRRVEEAPAAALGPGTGLGLACYLPGRDGGRVVASEGGHATLPGTCAREDAVIAHLRTRFGHVSAERVLSGGGLENLYDAVIAVEKRAAPRRIAPEITRAAIERTCPASEAALELFCAMLGTVAGNVALTLGARGGIYIAGGIVPRIADHLQASPFRARFEAKGRFRPYLEKITTSVILHPDPAFIGLAALAERRSRTGSRP